MHVLGELSVEQFLKDYWQKKPVLIRRAVDNFKSFISAEELAGLSLESEIESRIITENSESSSSPFWSLQKGPFNPDTFQQLPKDKWTLLIQAVDHWLPEAADFLEHFRFIPSWRLDDLMVSYATDGGSVGPHYDQYDVFLLQAEGVREWQVGQCCNGFEAMQPGSELGVLKDFSAEQTWQLYPGDILYLPPKVAHWGIAHGDCITYSIGFRAPSMAELFDRTVDELVPTLSESQRYIDKDFTFQSSSSQISDSTLKSLKASLVEQLDNSEVLAMSLGYLMTEAKYPEYAPVPSIEQQDAWDLFLKTVNDLTQLIITRHEHARFAYFYDQSKTEGSVLFFYQGDCAVLDEQDLELVTLLGDQRHYSPEALISLAQSTKAKALLSLLWESELIYLPE